MVFDLLLVDGHLEFDTVVFKLCFGFNVVGGVGFGFASLENRLEDTAAGFGSSYETNVFCFFTSG